MKRFDNVPICNKCLVQSYPPCCDPDCLLGQAQGAYSTDSLLRKLGATESRAEAVKRLVEAAKCFADFFEGHTIILGGHYPVIVHYRNLLRSALAALEKP